MNAYIERSKSRFIEYNNNMSATWKDRFIWRGLFGDEPKNSISITNFAKAGGFDMVDNSQRTVLTLKEQVDKLAKDYVKWAKSIYGKDLIAEEYDSLEKFFIGAMGEYFFMNLLQDVKCINAIDIQTGKVSRYDFNYVAPRLKGEQDYGVDLTGVLSHKADTVSCAIQVKFWNPFIEGIELTNKTAQGVHSDAMCNDFIDNSENGNIVVCWLGNTKQVSKYLKMNKKLYKHIVFIDADALDNSINGQNGIFWENLYDKIKNDLK